jgi:hydroxypyruvate isomerase
MNRRNFSKTLAGAALGALSSSIPQATSARVSEPTPFPLSVMLWTVEPKLAFERRLEMVAEAGYGAVELVREFEKWTDEDLRRVNARKRSLGIKFDATAGVWKGIADPGAREGFLSELKNFLPLAGKLECPGIIVLSGDRIEKFSRQAQHAACVETLKRAADLAAQQNVTLLLENIDAEENPKYFLTSVAEGFEIIREVGHPHVKFLYDFFHEQISEGNLIKKLEQNIDLVGLVHIADVPGRHEPGTGEINYANIFRKLADLKYDRYAAMEFEPSGDTVATLRAARQLVQRSVAGGGAPGASSYKIDF